MQQGQPVANASWPLTSAETRYSQIEKSYWPLYLPVTDLKPLESFMLKQLNRAPKWLQKMLLKLQKYNLKVKYMKVDQMFLADTLSAPLYLTSMHVTSHEACRMWTILLHFHLVMTVSRSLNMRQQTTLCCRFWGNDQPWLA